MRSRGTRFAVAACGRVRQNSSTGDLSFPMANTTPPTDGRENLSAGHLSVHVEGAHPADDAVPLRGTAEAPRAGAHCRRSPITLRLLVFVLLAFRYGADSAAPAVLPEQPNRNIIWLSEPGPGGGGGGGGNRDEGATAAGGVARQGQAHRPGRQAAETGGAQGDEGAKAGRAAEHSGADARGSDRVAARRNRTTARAAHGVARTGYERRRRHRNGNWYRTRNRLRVLALVPAATRAAARIGPAAASPCRPSFAK